MVTGATVRLARVRRLLMYCTSVETNDRGAGPGTLNLSLTRSPGEFVRADRCPDRARVAVRTSLSADGGPGGWHEPDPVDNRAIVPTVLGRRTV